MVFTMYLSVFLNIGTGKYFKPQGSILCKIFYVFNNLLNLYQYIVILNYNFLGESIW